MKNGTMPLAPAGRLASAVQSFLAPRALDRWNPGIRAADSDATISIYDVIGVDYWTGEGTTAKRISAALRAIGERDVVVNLNSPGGDLFEGLAIYNLLREHPGKVTVKVLALAASAASIVAMAGDTVQISRAGFMMIHNTWVVAQGNKTDLREIADQLEPFDAAMASIYAARTGLDAKAIAKQMDAETWIGGQAAIDEGFADELLPSEQLENTSSSQALAVRRIELALRQSGMPRSEAMKLISEFKSGLSDSAGTGERDATVDGPSESDLLHALAADVAALTTLV